jgi:acetolactate decarboxylase
VKFKAKIMFTVFICVFIVFSVFFVAGQYQTHPGNDRDTLFQLAAFNTFSMGNYTGTMSYADLGAHGDFGIGTFDGLDGEMIALGNVFYQIPSNGIPREVQPTQTAPYATITYFEADQTFSVSNLTYAELRTYLDAKLTSKNAIYAIKITGTFQTAQTRSPEKQTQPYLNITLALTTQHLFNLTDVSATAVGFWFPASMDGIDYAGYHLHLITDDRAAGGHLLDCIISSATVELDQINRYQLVLP